MDTTRHLLISVVLSTLIIIIGTAGYVLIEDWGILDALFMTIITISTVGYREVHDVGTVGRIFSIFLIFSGVGFTLYVAAAVVQFMVEGRIRIIMGRRLMPKDAQLIVCQMTNDTIMVRIVEEVLHAFAVFTLPCFKGTNRVIIVKVGIRIINGQGRRITLPH